MARLRFATFDNPEEPNLKAKGDKPINQRNCQMTANILNARAEQGNYGALTTHYWCEKGTYREKAA